MKATRDPQERPAQEMPPEYSWTTAAGMKHSSLARHLCDLGRESKGKSCKACEAQCAFGRHYLGIKDPEYRFQKKRPEPRRVLQAYDKEGSVIGEWDTIKEAAESLGIRSRSKISGSVNHGTTHRGLRWRWVETEG